LFGKTLFDHYTSQEQFIPGKKQYILNQLKNKEEDDLP